MNDITFKNGVAIPQKRKRKKSAGKRVLIALLIIFIGIPALLVGLVYILFYDSSHQKIKVRAEYPTQEVFNEIVTHSFDYAESDHMLRMRLTEKSLNQIFYNVLHESGKKIDIIKNLYVKINNTHYVFCVEIDLHGYFKTKLEISTKLTINSEKLIFKVADVKLGKVNGLDALVKWILGKLDLPDVNKVLHDAGFNMNFNLKDLSLNYPKENFFQDLGNTMEGSASDYMALFMEIMSNELFTTIIPNKEKAVELEIKLENMRPTSALYNIEDYVVPEGYLDTIITNSVNHVKTYLDNKIISPDDANVVANYYVSGYDYLSDNDKQIIDSYLSITPGIEAATNTYNYDIPPEDDLVNIAVSQISSQGALADNYVVEFDTNQIDKALSQATSIGETVIFKSYDEEDIYTVNYITMDRVSNVIDSTNNIFYIALSMNFNGYSAIISLDTRLVEDYSDFGKARFKVENMYLGDEPLSEDGKNHFLNIVRDVIDDNVFGGIAQFIDDGNNQYLMINLTNLLALNGITSANGYTTSFELLEQTSTTPGKIKFRAYK